MRAPVIAVGVSTGGGLMESRRTFLGRAGLAAAGAAGVSSVVVGDARATANAEIAKYLSDSRTQLLQTSQYISFKADNPWEAGAIDTYWLNGGAVPAIANPFGKALLLEAKAYRVAVGDTVPATTPPPPPPPTTGLVIAAPVGPFTTLDGGGTAQSGVFDRSNGSPLIEKKYAKRYTGYGIANMGYWVPQPSTGTSTIRDCIAEDITANPPRSMNGTGEAGFWIGQRTNATRLVARRAAWMGMWTGAQCNGSLITDFELLEMPHVGLYVEHVTQFTTFRNFRIKSADNGVNVEWWYADSAYSPFVVNNPRPGKAGSHDLVFENFDVRSDNGWCFFLDAGTYNVTIRNGKLSGRNGIAIPANKANPSGYITIDWASIDSTGLTGQRTMTHSNPIG